MEITVRELKPAVLITITERLDGSTAPAVADVLESLQYQGKYKLVIDISRLEYISSAGYRVLLSAQRNSMRYERGEVILVGVPEPIRQTLDMSGFTAHFKIYNEISAVPDLEDQLAADDSTTDAKYS